LRRTRLDDADGGRRCRFRLAAFVPQRVAADGGMKRCRAVEIFENERIVAALVGGQAPQHCARPILQQLHDRGLRPARFVAADGESNIS
jgi:hypothetical protein